ncbi:MAG: ornithine carbamoyltransferase [Polyangiaceae bacterium]
MKRDFLKLADLSAPERTSLIARARALKARRKQGIVDATMAGKTLALLFEKPSTRTKLSFEAAMTQLGGGTIAISATDSQLSRGETLSDTAKVVSRYADVIVFRTFGDARLRELAEAASVPVINGLSDEAHPVQLLADLMTIEEHLGKIAGATVAFVGDGTSNMALSWVEAAGLFDFSLRIGAPQAFSPAAARSAKNVQLFESAEEAVRGVDVVATDVWTSMGQEAEAAERKRILMPYQLNGQLVAGAAASAIVLHCLPAHRGEEITGDVVDGPQSVVFDEAENRMHAQKALLEILLPPTH